MDRRERILNRLGVLLQEVVADMPGWFYARNRGELPDELRPSLVLLDGDEIISFLQPSSSRGQMRTAPMVMSMSPQIFAVLKDREPKNEGVAEDLASTRRLILPKLLPSVVNDVTLKQLVGSNGFMRYEGFLTDMASGRSMKGEGQFNFAFGYVLRLDELEQGV